MLINQNTAAFEVNSIDLIISELQYFVKVWITDTAINNPNLATITTTTTDKNTFI